MGFFRPKWHPSNWKDLTDAEQDALREKHRGPRRLKRKEFWSKVWGAVDPLVKEAVTALPDEIGDSRREWVVDQVQQFADKLATAPGMAGMIFEEVTDRIIYSDWFESMIDHRVQEAYDRLKGAGELPAPE